MKFYLQDAGHMTKMAARLYVVKPFKNPFLQNRWTSFHKTWYVAFGAPAHHSLFKWWPWVDLDLFYSKVKFCNLGFSIKNENSIFFQKLLQPVTWKLVDADK